MRMKLTWVAHTVLIVVVRQVCIGCAATESKLQHHHAWRSYALPESVHIYCDHAQVLCYNRHMAQLLQHEDLH